MFVCDGEGVAGGWIKLHNEKLYGMKFSSNIIIFIELRRMMM